MKFNINQPFTINVTGAFKETTTVIFCDYTRAVTVRQNDQEYPARVGYCGRDKKTTKPRYLFLGDKIYYLDDATIDMNISVFDTSDFPSWLVL